MTTVLQSANVQMVIDEVGVELELLVVPRNIQETPIMVRLILNSPTLKIIKTLTELIIKKTSKLPGLLSHER